MKSKYANAHIYFFIAQNSWYEMGCYSIAFAFIADFAYKSINVIVLWKGVQKGLFRIVFVPFANIERQFLFDEKWNRCLYFKEEIFF